MVFVDAMMMVMMMRVIAIVMPTAILLAFRRQIRVCIRHIAEILAIRLLPERIVRVAVVMVRMMLVIVVMMESRARVSPRCVQTEKGGQACGQCVTQ